LTIRDNPCGTDIPEAQDRILDVFDRENAISPFEKDGYPSVLIEVTGRTRCVSAQPRFYHKPLLLDKISL